MGLASNLQPGSCSEGHLCHHMQSSIKMDAAWSHQDNGFHVCWRYRGEVEGGGLLAGGTEKISTADFFCSCSRLCRNRDPVSPQHVPLRDNYSSSKCKMNEPPKLRMLLVGGRDFATSTSPQAEPVPPALHVKHLHDRPRWSFSERVLHSGRKQTEHRRKSCKKDLSARSRANEVITGTWVSEDFLFTPLFHCVTLQQT